MSKVYLDLILDGKRTYDARSYDTKNRGTIAIVDSQKNAIIGLAELTRTYQITAEEYIKWHLKDEYQDYEVDMSQLEGKHFYAYELHNARRLASAVLINRDKNRTTWIDIDDEVYDEFYYQESLF